MLHILFLTHGQMKSGKLMKDYNIVIWPNELQLKDVNDMIVSGMSKAKVQTIISTNTFSKLEALTKLSYYKKC